MATATTHCLFAKEGSLDSDSLKDLRVDFIRDFSGYVDNLLAPDEQVKIAWLMLKIDCPAHQHGQKTYSVAI
jgi:hypothetical protein